MSLTRLAVARPVTTMMSCLIVVLLGWVALGRLSVDLMPNLTYPTVSVTTLYYGAGPAEIETLITRPMEQALSAVTGVERISSTSTEGSSTIRVRLQWGADVDAAVNNMRQAIAKIRQYLPEDVEEPYIIQYDVADRPILYLGLASDLPPIEVARLAEKQIAPRLERIQGVARVSLRGAVRREIQVDVHRSQLEARNISVLEVAEALSRQSANQPGGDFDEGHIRRLVRSQGEFTSLAEVADTVVVEQAGRAVRIRDLADVVDGEEERTELARTNGQPGVMIYVYKQSGANTVDVSDRVRAAVEELNGQLADASLTVRIDQADFIRQAIANVRDSAWYGMLLAVLVLIVFLRSFRSTLVIAVSMPLSVLATFVLIYFKGFTLNMISFGGLALGIGLLVDNSIVVLESIYRKRSEGLDRRRAAVEGTAEVASAIVASTLTTLIVFLPLLFVDGITGLMLHQLAWVVSMALVASLGASLTLTPMLAACVGDQIEQGRGRPGLLRRLVEPLVRRLHATNQRLFASVEQGYRRLLGLALGQAGPTAFVLLLAFSATLGLVPRVGTEFLPKTDAGDLRIDGRMAPGIQLAVLDRQTRQMEDIIRQNTPEAEVTAALIGERPENGEEWNTCRFRIRLAPRDQRARTIDEIRRDLDDRLVGVAGVKLRVQASSDMLLFRLLGRTGSSSSSGDVEIEIAGHDTQAALALAEQVAAAMHEVPGLVNIEVQKQDQRPELAARIDRAKAGLLGISVRDIVDTLEATVRGTRANVYHDDGDEFNVRVRLRHSDRDRQLDIEHVGVATPTGRIVPLRNLVDFQSDSGAMAINRLDQQRVVAVSADVEGRDLGGAVRDLGGRLARIPLPRGFSLHVAGDWEEQQKSFALLRQGFLLAVLLMFMVMASQFESLRDPLIIMVSVPLGAVGVILMLVATGTTLNVQSFIGVVMLAGIVVNNAIVLVDYMNQLRAAEPEASLDDIVVRAAVRRLRPVLMTTATTVLAMVPVAMGWGQGGELQAPMARVVIGGLLSGTVITLVAIPLIYRYAARRSNKVGPVAELKSATVAVESG